MKKRWIVPITAVLLILLLPTVFKWHGRWYYGSYYEKTENYVTATGKVTHIANTDEWGLLLGIEDTSVPFSDVGFVFEGDNQRIVLENGILEKLQIGDQVEFTSNGWYPGDGYSMPIVAICVDGEWLLEFEEGYANLVEYFWTR